MPLSKPSGLDRPIEAARVVADWEAIHGPLEIGQQGRMNHTSCPAGADTRGRLYLKAKAPDDGSAGRVVLVYCHNCTTGGIAAGSRGAVPRARGRSVGIVPPTLTFAGLPPTLVPLLDPATPAEAREFFTPQFHRAHNLDRLFPLGVGFDTDTQRVVLPVYDTLSVGLGRPNTGRLLGYQSRRVGAYGPKYLTVRESNDPLEMLITSDHRPPPSCVTIVEDWQSAYLLADGIFNTAVVPLLGVHVRPEFLARLVTEYNKVVIWLDDDNETVRHQQTYIRRLATALGGAAIVVCGEREPKHQDSTRMESIMTTHAGISV